MKTKKIFYCSDCGNEFSKWSGQCSACGSWNTLVEAQVSPETRHAKTSAGIETKRAKPLKLSEIGGADEIRFPTGIDELDRVLGGGAVVGSLVLVGGAPGIGKSTLLLQMCRYIGRLANILYVTGEESAGQLKMRANRLGVTGEGLEVLPETALDVILACVAESGSNVLIVDSIQTLYDPDNTGAPGSIGQVRGCTMALMKLAKESGVTVFVVGHVNKDGDIAGPKILEHMVDCVLYFEGESSTKYRIVRAAKNRFGSTNEIGVFEMEDKGLREVSNPSETLLSGRPLNVPGTCVACVMEGTRPVLAEIQALVSKSSFSAPRRVSDGFDFNRSLLLLAVLEKRGGLNIGSCDTYINVIGGLKLDDPAADLPAVIALASSLKDTPVDSSLAAVGEVGLTGELRGVTALGQRLSEISRLGFKRVIVPKQGSGGLVFPEGLEVIRAKNVREAIEAAM